MTDARRAAGWRPYGEVYGRELGHEVYVLPELASVELKNQRPLFVALPHSYHRDPARTFPVAYLQDGQNLFDPETSYAGSWRALETQDGLSQEGLDVVLVGIPNRGRARFFEYTPFLTPREGPPGADRYLAFVVRTLLPTVEASFRVSRRRTGRAIGGASLGGLLSLYAFFAYPEIFGGCLALSPSLQVVPHQMATFVEGSSRRDGRIYLDVGTREVSRPRRRFNSRHYGANVTKMRDLLKRRGYRLGRGLEFVRAKRAGHHEAFWGARLPGALRFVFGESA